MSEIEKMYENAGFQKKRKCEWDKDKESCFHSGFVTCDKCTAKIERTYPPFTAEKQLELIKFLLKNYEGIDICKRINRFNFLVDNATFAGCRYDDKSFEGSLAGVINRLWADMSEEEKQQVKGILE